MSLQIPLDVEQLARLIAIKTGKTPESILREAVEAKAQTTGIGPHGRRRTPEQIEQRINEIVQRVSTLPILDDRSADEIIGYNDIGVPE
jgi:antitoxin VapB